METQLEKPSDRQRRGQRIILIIAAVCLLPLAAALMFRYVWTLPTVPSLGEVVTPQAFPYEQLIDLKGKPLVHEAVTDGWLMVYAAPGACDTACQQALYLTRQSRTAQGKGSLRLERLWVITDATEPTAELVAAHPDLTLARPLALESVIGLGGIKASPRYIHLVDRRGQIVMRYSDTPEPMKFIKEVGRLIKF